MATFTLPQSLVDSMHTRNVDMETFMALEKRVDHITAKLAQVAPGRIDLRGLKPNHFPKFAVHALPMTTETSSAASPRPSLAIAPENILPSTPDVDLPEPATLGTHGGTAISDRPSEKLALQILDIIQMYGHNVGSGNSQWAGKAKFMPIVEAYVVKNEPVKMVLPAFPCKSPNRVGKVLGSMPDLGEELALMHLNGLCESVAEIYGPGARVVITSDGLVYNGNSEAIF